MRLLRLSIEGYRGVREAEVWLAPHTVLLGQNGIGKSSLVDAAALLLGRGRLSGSLSDYDFWGDFPDETSRIYIRGLLSDFEPNNIVANPLWFGASGGVPVWLDPSLRNGTWPALVALAADAGAVFAARSAGRDLLGVVVPGDVWTLVGSALWRRRSTPIEPAAKKESTRRDEAWAAATRRLVRIDGTLTVWSIAAGVFVVLAAVLVLLAT